MGTLFGGLGLLIGIFVVFVLPMIAGIWFCQRVGKYSKKIFYVSALFYFALIPFAIWMALRGYDEFSFLMIFSLEAPIGAVLGVVLHCLASRIKYIPRLIGNALPFIAIWCFICVMYPVRIVLLDKMGFGASLDQVLNAYDFPSEEGVVQLYVPRPYFSSISDRYATNPLNKMAWLSLCYPSMTPWALKCGNHKDEWKLDLLLEPNSKTIYGSERPIPSYIRNRQALQQALTYPEAVANKNYANGLVVLPVPDNKLNTDMYGGQYIVPTPVAGASFFYTCGSWKPNQLRCNRHSLESGPLIYSYFMPEDALAFWPEIEDKISIFVKSLKSPTAHSPH